MKNRKWLSILSTIIIILASIFFTAYLKSKRRDRTQNFISEILYKEEVKKEKEVYWVKNSFHGLIFETPNIGLNPNDEFTDFDFPGVKNLKSNQLATGDLLYSVFYMEVEFENYNFEMGMEGVLNNLVYEINGSDLMYQFKYGESWLPFGLAEGEFKLKSEQIALKAFLSFNKTQENQNKLRSLVIFANKTDQNMGLMASSIERINLDSLKKENNRGKYVAEKYGQIIKNYDPFDTLLTPQQKTALKNLRDLREGMKTEKGDKK
ncbi:hypothetical protein [Mongoliitalea daihaiensis]|uniref:hypothetical protein n=1 Tax=Mongoliitalea daihaiensis TaxID=2782006 RepID=UPI001F1AE4A0|nr:hypothetical protein [Mongoliitalea daihaiensis]UJP65174.1 hypothetical protein IPZ59_00620 [Mongoliitalea daihaiensis]